MMGLCLALIVLQAADGYSTHLALATGRATEQNDLIVSLAHLFHLPVIEMVFVAKFVTCGIFGATMVQGKATPMGVIALLLLAAYLGQIVVTNFYWAWTLA